jgi:hypothetical protein
MSAIIRNVGPRGPRFYEDQGALMFINVIDASTKEGPREATDEDRKEHPRAYEAMGANMDDLFPGAKPLISFTGRAPPGTPDPTLLAKPALEEPAPRAKLHLKGEAA